MRTVIRLAVVLVCLQGAAPAVAQDLEEIIALERAAMDRWAKGDPSGFLELMAPDVTVFDAFAARRLDGRDAVAKHYEPFRGRVAIPRYEFLNPAVQPLGTDAAVLAYNFIAYGAANEVLSRWNFSEVYRRTGGRWQIVQSHASYTLGQPPRP